MHGIILLQDATSYDKGLYKTTLTHERIFYTAWTLDESLWFTADQSVKTLPIYDLVCWRHVAMDRLGTLIPGMCHLIGIIPGIVMYLFYADLWYLKAGFENVFERMYLIKLCYVYV